MLVARVRTLEVYLKSCQVLPSISDSMRMRLTFPGLAAVAVQVELLQNFCMAHGGFSGYKTLQWRPAGCACCSIMQHAACATPSYACYVCMHVLAEGVLKLVKPIWYLPQCLRCCPLLMSHRQVWETLGHAFEHASLLGGLLAS